MTDLRRLGASHLHTPKLCLGGNVFGWTADKATSFAVLDAFVDAGGTLVDTADVYSAWVPGHKGGESESVIGEWIKSSGKKVGIATKVGMLPSAAGEKLAPGRIAEACDASLQRLGVEQIALYYAHQDDEATPQEAYMEAFAKLVAAGKVAALGASNFTPRGSSRPTTSRAPPVCRIFRFSNPNTIWSAGTSSKANCRIIASNIISACCLITGWPPAS